MHAISGDRPHIRRGAFARLRELPTALRVGGIVGALAFVVSVDSYAMRTVDGVRESCTYYDYAALLAGITCLICVPAAWSAHRRRSTEVRSATWLMSVSSLVLVALALVHGLRGLGVVGGPCT